VSDGGAAFEAKSAGNLNVFNELPRALDIVYKGAGWRDAVRSKALPRIQLLRATDIQSDTKVEALWKTFKDTDTLTATFGAGQAQGLFHLGEELVERNWPQLRVLLHEAREAAKARGPATSRN
jgi:hypothetical protein